MSKSLFEHCAFRLIYKYVYCEQSSSQCVFNINNRANRNSDTSVNECILVAQIQNKKSIAKN